MEWIGSCQKGIAKKYTQKESGLYPTGQRQPTVIIGRG